MSETISLITKLNWQQEASRIVTDPLFELTHKYLPRGCHPSGERAGEDALSIEAQRVLRPWNNLYYTHLLRLTGKCLIEQCQIRDKGLCPLSYDNLIKQYKGLGR